MERLKRALSVLEDDAARKIDVGDLQRYTVVRVADEVLVDLLAAACGVTWSEAQASALRVDLDGTGRRKTCRGLAPRPPTRGAGRRRISAPW